MVDLNEPVPTDPAAEIEPCCRGWCWPIRMTLALLVCVVVVITFDMVTERGELLMSPGADIYGPIDPTGPDLLPLAPPLPGLVEVDEMPKQGEDREPEPALELGPEDREPGEPRP